MKQTIKVPRSPSLARGMPSKGAPSAPSLSTGAGPSIAAFLSVATPVVSEVARIIPMVLDEFMKAVTTGVEEGIREIASSATRS